jgi:CRISPR-associated endonuclease/helicase Cas3
MENDQRSDGMKYIAHIRASDHQIQSVEEHLLGVQKLAESYGAKIGVKHIAGLAGMLHDMGKYTKEFFEYILEAVNNPDSPPKRGSVDHSSAGGRLLYERFHTGKNKYTWILAEVVGNATISHHSYLHDFISPELKSDYLRRVENQELPGFKSAVQCFFDNVMDETSLQEYVKKAANELELYLRKQSSLTIENKLMYLTKYIFSALIDADRTNTRLFEENKNAEPEQDCKALFEDYYDKLMDKMAVLQVKEDAHTTINQLRRQMSERCDQFAERPSGIYKLSIPTGGGKTLASLRYALKHAKKYGKKHIIYVVPYTTIIEQNAAEVREIIKDDANLLEHHSNVIDDLDDNDEMQDGKMSVQQKLKLAKDNWDVPIIFTTMVQFLNVFYAKGSRNIRRLHNLSESIIIFDEVQKVPVSCVSLFNHALNFLKTYANSSILLCTATQPALDFVEQKLELNADAEIIENLNEVVEAFKRVEIVDRATDESFDTDKLEDLIAEKMTEVQSVLVILNTKTVVNRLYRQLLESGTIDSNILIYHLSTSMCAAHRKDILEEVRDCLDPDNRRKVICISTQLIEAGVDVSFECVIRSLAGLDSIAQAAGRCNRHGEYGIRQVYVIDHEEENLQRLREIKAGKKTASLIFVDMQRDCTAHGGNLLSDQAVSRYFQELYRDFKSSLNYVVPKLGKDMMELLATDRRDPDSYFHAYVRNKKNDSPPLFIVSSYRTAAEYFHVIDDQTQSVIVPYKEGADIIAQFNGDESIADLSRLLKESQQYTINLFRNEFERLDNNGGLVSLLEGKVLALTEGAYDKEFGLNLENDSHLGFSVF